MSLMAGLAGSPSGHLVNTIYGHEAFVPDYLPRTVELNSELVFLLGEATAVVGKLAGVGETLPNPHLLIRPFVNNEAVSSSRIEGTVASISDLYRYQASGKTRADVLEIVNYVRALDHGLEQLQSLPICVRLMNQMYAKLLERSEGPIRCQEILELVQFGSGRRKHLWSWQGMFHPRLTG